MIPTAQPADVPIAVHSYTDISLGPKQFINGVIPLGATTATLVVPRIECGQLDIKAVFTTPGDSTGNIAGPGRHMGRRLPDRADHHHCADTRVAVERVAVSVSPTNVQPTIPSTGTAGVVPWTWALPPWRWPPS